MGTTSRRKISYGLIPPDAPVDLYIPLLKGSGTLETTNPGNALSITGEFKTDTEPESGQIDYIL
jgi:hypothetical protein